MHEIAAGDGAVVVPRADLVGAYHQRKLLRLLDVPHLGRQIVATQRDAEQEPHPGHDPIAMADARTALDEVQLETPA